MNSAPQIVQATVFSEETTYARILLHGWIIHVKTEIANTGAQGNIRLPASGFEVLPGLEAVSQLVASELVEADDRKHFLKEAAKLPHP